MTIETLIPLQVKKWIKWKLAEGMKPGGPASDMYRPYGLANEILLIISWGETGKKSDCKKEVFNVKEK